MIKLMFFLSFLNSAYANDSGSQSLQEKSLEISRELEISRKNAMKRRELIKSELLKRKKVIDDRKESPINAK